MSKLGSLSPRTARLRHGMMQPCRHFRIARPHFEGLCPCEYEWRSTYEHGAQHRGSSKSSSVESSARSEIELAPSVADEFDGDRELRTRFCCRIVSALASQNQDFPNFRPVHRGRKGCRVRRRNGRRATVRKCCIHRGTLEAQPAVHNPARSIHSLRMPSECATGI
jgi:hypothetical protein